ncbi:MAG: MaoC family dehydratase [Alphaproteobacteria bacterium]|nr:MaoC family dehydratase [Alphaproteobacteria bacterium]
MLDKSYIGKTYPRFVFEVEKGRIRQFADAIGDPDPIYRDVAVARAAGYRTVPAPPTFAFVAVMDSDQMFMPLRELGVDMTRTLHGEQWFDYGAPIYAGDLLSGETRIVDIYDKKGGALEFIVLETALTNQTGERAATMRGIVVVRN